MKKKSHSNAIILVDGMKAAAKDPQHPNHRKLSDWAGIEIGSSGHDSVPQALSIVESADISADHILALVKTGTWESFVNLRLVTGLEVLAIIAKADSEAKAIARQLFSTSGGKAPKKDPLQELILTIVKKRPTITSSELLNTLEKYKGFGVVEDIEDEDIWFINNRRSDSSPISGLKDRLSRAKKTLGLSKGKKRFFAPSS